MGIFSRSTLKGWFVTRAKPTQSQYQSLIDSCFNVVDDTLPITQVANLNNTINDLYSRVNTNSSGQPVSNSETFTVTGDFQKLFAAGKTLDSILIDPPSAGAYSINIGKTAGGNDVEDSFEVDGDEPEAFVYPRKFKGDETWYFSGVPAGSVVTIYYKG